MHVIRRDDLHSQFLRQPEYGFVGYQLFLIYLRRKAGHFGLVQLDFQIIVLPEKFLVPEYGRSGRLQVPVDYVSRHLSGKAGRTADEVLVILRQHLVAHPRLVVVLALYMAGRDYLHQVFVALVVLGEQYKMVVLPVVIVLQPVVIMPGDIHLAADDGLDRRMLGRRLEELLDAVHIAVVGNRKGRHTQFLRPFEQLGDV